MIKNVILDIGNVIVKFSWKKHLDRFGFSEETANRVAKAVFLNEDWNEIDRGVLTMEELLRRFVQNDPGVEKEIYAVMENISTTIESFDYSDTWIPQLQSMGYKVYLLSNFSEKQLHDSAQKLKFIEQADGAILSYRYKIIKPDDAIYRLLLKTFDLNADECLFFDDREENVLGAEQNGIHASVFTDYGSAMKTLEQRSVQERHGSSL